MSLKVHHIGCGTICPRAGAHLGVSRMVCHCLLIEAGSELILVDTGFGTGDVRDPGRLGRPLALIADLRLDMAETAIEQVRALGFDPADVRHIVVTHLDPDHAGGIGDFPGAEVHVFGDEHRAATAGALADRVRYGPLAAQAAGAQWVLHEPDGDSWLGFERVRVLEDAAQDVALIPLRGHTLGHCGVAVPAEGGWLLHCGDAYFHHGDIETPRRAPKALQIYQATTGRDNDAREHNRQRLAELARERAGEIELICSHDPYDLDSRTG